MYLKVLWNSEDSFPEYAVKECDEYTVGEEFVKEQNEYVRMIVLTKEGYPSRSLYLYKDDIVYVQNDQGDTIDIIQSLEIS